MFNLFKRDKSANNPDSQPAPEHDPTGPGSEETTEPLTTAETSSEKPLSPPAAESAAPVENIGQIAPDTSPAAAQQGTGAAVPPERSGVEEPPSPRKSILYHVFSLETRPGRILRPVLRWLAAITGLFALGLLAGYILLYQPAQQELDSTLAGLEKTNQLVTQKEQGLQSAQTGLDQAQLDLKQIQDRLEAAASENSLLVVMVEISNARVALVNKDGAAAKTAIAQAQTNLNQALPYIASQDKVLSDLLMSRLDLIAKELVSDPQAAQSDLEKLASDIKNLHQKIFGK